MKNELMIYQDCGEIGIGLSLVPPQKKVWVSRPLWREGGAFVQPCKGNKKSKTYIIIYFYIYEMGGCCSSPSWRVRLSNECVLLP